MKKSIVILLSMLFLTSCASFQLNKTSVCDNLNEPSYFCEISNKYNMNVEDVANVIRIGNAIAISKNKYTAQNALDSLKTIRNALNYNVSYLFVQSTLFNLKSNYPEIFVLSSILINRELNKAQFMYKADKEMLIKFVDQLIEDMNLMIATEK